MPNFCAKCGAKFQPEDSPSTDFCPQHAPKPEPRVEESPDPYGRR